MTHTTNYKLSQWSKSDRILMSDFNSDNQKVDAALAAKASASALSAVASRVSSLETDTAPRAEAAARVVSGTYTGTGTVEPRTLNFAATLGRPPKLVLVRAVEDASLSLTLVYGSRKAVYSCDVNAVGCDVTWGGTSVSWVSTSSTAMLNNNGKVYAWVAIG